MSGSNTAATNRFDRKNALVGSRIHHHLAGALRWLENDCRTHAQDDFSIAVSGLRDSLVEKEPCEARPTGEQPRYHPAVGAETVGEEYE